MIPDRCIGGRAIGAKAKARDWVRAEHCAKYNSRRRNEASHSNLRLGATSRQPSWLLLLSLLTEDKTTARKTLPCVAW